MKRPTKAFAAGVLLLLTVLTAAMTYPQVLRLGDGVNDYGDPLLNAWALRWVAHALPTAPTRIFDANIFDPEHNTLAFSETLLAPGIIAAPLSWLGAGAILVYNLVFLSGFVISGVGAALLVYALVGDRGAAIVAGIIFAFLPYRMDHYAHLQLQQTQFIPLALWALHKVVASGRIRDGVLLGACVAGQLLSCMYYGIFLIPYLAVVAAALLIKGRLSKDWANSRLGVHLQLDLTGWRQRIAALAVGAVLCLVIVAPAGRAYLAARELVGERGTREVAIYSATWRNFLATSDGNALYGRATERFGDPERRLFAGVVPVLLTLVALWPPLSRVRVAYALGLFLAIDMSLGFNGLTYRFLYDHLLPFRALRIPARMGLFVGFSLAVLSGYGVARLRRLVSPRMGMLIAVGCSCLVLIEYRSNPLQLQSIPRKPPRIYSELLRISSDSAQPIVEVPIARQDEHYTFSDPTYMYYSTFHWHPLVNGYSGFLPPSYNRIVDRLRFFPSDEALEALRGRGTRYIVVHGELLRWQTYREMIVALDQRQDVKLVARSPWQEKEISLYEVRY